MMTIGRETMHSWDGIRPLLLGCYFGSALGSTLRWLEKQCGKAAIMECYDSIGFIMPVPGHYICCFMPFHGMNNEWVAGLLKKTVFVEIVQNFANIKKHICFWSHILMELDLCVCNYRD